MTGMCFKGGDLPGESAGSAGVGVPVGAGKLAGDGVGDGRSGAEGIIVEGEADGCVRRFR